MLGPETLFSSLGRAGIPCAEAGTPLQRTEVRVRAWGPLWHVTLPLPQPVPVMSSAVLSIKKAKMFAPFYWIDSPLLCWGYLSSS